MEVESSQKLKIGLLVDTDIAPHHVYDLVQWAQNQPRLEISHLVVQTLPSACSSGLSKITESFKKSGIITTLERISFACLQRVELLLLRCAGRAIHPLKTYDLSGCVKNRIEVAPSISKSGFVYRYNDEAIAAIKNANLDMLIRCGSGILRGDILHATRFGILSFHHADNRVNRGGPAAFWEVALKQDTTGFTIQQLTEELDGGNVLYQGWFPTKSFYLLNKAALYEKANVYLKTLLSGIASSGALPQALASFPYYNPLYKIPNLWIQLRYGGYLVRTAAQRVLKQLLFSRSYCWGVAFSFGGWRNLVMWRAMRIPNPPRRFLADPFVITRDGVHYCFLEDYDYHVRKGCISVYQLTSQGAVRLGEVINEPFHMSYPFLFEYESNLYMCPETSGNRDIRIYECMEFPLRWKLKQVAMSDLSAVDTTIFEKDGLWWLFTNLDPANTGDHCSELSIFYADNPLAGRWMPHPKNPVMVDASRARNGGILWDGDTLFRVSQQQGFNRYGKAMLINQIMQLSKTDYQEACVAQIESNFFEGIKGTHHLHSNGKVTVFDFVEEVL